MKIIIKTKNLTLTEYLSNFIEEKISGLKKFVNILKEDSADQHPEMRKTLAEVFVELKKETLHHKKGQIFSVKIRIHLPGKSLISFAKTDDLLAAVVEARNELKAEIEKYKLKTIDKNRRKQRKTKYVNIV